MISCHSPCELADLIFVILVGEGVDRVTTFVGFLMQFFFVLAFVLSSVWAGKSLGSRYVNHLSGGDWGASFAVPLM